MNRSLILASASRRVGIHENAESIDWRGNGKNNFAILLGKSFFINVDNKIGERTFFLGASIHKCPNTIFFITSCHRDCRPYKMVYTLKASCNHAAARIRLRRTLPASIKDGSQGGYTRRVIRECVYNSVTGDTCGGVGAPLAGTTLSELFKFLFIEDERVPILNCSLGLRP